MNRVIAACISAVFFLAILSIPVTSINSGMETYQQADLQCITHPDLFYKWSSQNKRIKEIAIKPKTDDLPPRDPKIIVCGFPPSHFPPSPFFPVHTVYFDYDKSILKPKGKANIQRNVEHLKSYFPKARILVEGNCDERGTNEYNLALGERRAQAVKKYMVSLSIDESRITTKSLGEERPVALGHDESSWWQNRRGDMYFVEQ